MLPVGPEIGSLLFCFFSGPVRQKFRPEPSKNG
jgi:hypothetical protein